MLQYRYQMLLLCSLFLCVSGYAEEKQGGHFTHKIKKGESVSLICIDYYGRYTPQMGDAIKKDNSSVADINIIHTGNTLNLQKPHTPSKKKTPSKKQTPSVALFEKKAAVTQGVVTCVEGGASLKKKGKNTRSKLTVNTLVYPGDVLETDAKGRVEIIVNRESVLRMKENTRLTLDAFRDTAKKKGATLCNLKGGTLWTKVKNFTDKICRFELSLPTAVAGVYGTVYQTSLAQDSTAEVKVYNGEVAVKNQPAMLETSIPGGLEEVAGPGEVAGPHEVTMEEWTQIVRTMQKITIGKDGTPSDVSSFEKEPASSWEQWNEERDKRIAQLFSE